ncbi:MAG: molecular chaperone DnaJ, partial [Desulfonatronovibrio sp. MSAO_Bac4]
MNIQQCYQILGVGPDADLNSIKKAYRDLAFKSHPDLNQDDPEAGYKFHRINTAYVTLRDYLGDKQPRAEATAREKAGAKPGQSRAKASRTYHEQAGRARREKKKYGEDFDPDARRKKFFYRQEEVLKDILNDPFARQVFEDIFQKIKKDGVQYPGAPVIKKRRLKFEWGKYHFDLDLSKGLFSGIRRWFSSQLDDEQTVYMNPVKLRPGATVRINVQRKWSGPAQTVNVTL